MAFIFQGYPDPGDGYRAVASIERWGGGAEATLHIEYEMPPPETP